MGVQSFSCNDSKTVNNQIHVHTYNSKESSSFASRKTWNFIGIPGIIVEVLKWVFLENSVFVLELLFMFNKRLTFKTVLIGGGTLYLAYVYLSSFNHYKIKKIKKAKNRSKR